MLIHNHTRDIVPCYRLEYYLLTIVSLLNPLLKTNHPSRFSNTGKTFYKEPSKKALQPEFKYAWKQPLFPSLKLEKKLHDETEKTSNRNHLFIDHSL